VCVNVRERERERNRLTDRETKIGKNKKREREIEKGQVTGGNMLVASAKDEDCKSENIPRRSVSILQKPSRLQGMKIRDEFLCPITHELLREPVVALDGHTYERSAIEKWLGANHTSPRSGESMDESLVTNTNLKKLIQDMIIEGGASLYSNDVSDSERLIDVSAEKVLILKCLGPPESDWNMQSFQVTLTLTLTLTLNALSFSI
jgi:hypothetical protein